MLKNVKRFLNFFYFVNKYQSVTHVSTSIFMDFSKISFLICSFSLEKVMGYIRFFHRPDFLSHCMHKINFKKYSTFLSIENREISR